MTTQQRAVGMLAAHWRVDTAALSALLPSPLQPSLYEGQAWMTLMVMHVDHAHPTGLPSIPGMSSFDQLGVRTYVTDGERSGAWIFGVRANSRVGSFIAHELFRLPVRYGHIALSDVATPPVVAVSDGLASTYEPHGEARLPRAGSLDAFLGERDTVFVTDRRGRLMTGHVVHEVTPLCDATVTLADTRFIAEHALAVTGAPDAAHWYQAMPTTAALPRRTAA